MEHHKEEPGDNLRDVFPTLRSGLAPRGPDCPSLEDWALYQAGLQSEGKAAELLTHASGCGACGALLADMAVPEALADAVQNEQVLTLRSGTESWKLNMLARLQQSGPSPNFVKPRSVWRPARWMAAAAAAFLLLIAVGLSSNSLLWLLNRTGGRAFEFRISGSKYQPLRTTRGVDGQDNVPFLIAKLLVALRSKVYARARPGCKFRAGPPWWIAMGWTRSRWR